MFCGGRYLKIGVARAVAGAVVVVVEADTNS